MKLREVVLVIGVVVMLTSAVVAPAGAGFEDFFKNTLGKVLESNTGLSENEIIQGLKEALEIGTDNSVTLLSRVDGFYKHPDVKIFLPEKVKQVESLLRTAGLGAQVDSFELSMNRAAEQAAPEARKLFWDAITRMTFDDAKNILEGRENEATLFFKDKTSTRLTELFAPIAHSAMAAVGVTRAWQDLDNSMSQIPFVESFRFDLDAYVTGKTLDGLFFMLEQEERKIRQDPASRVTELLEKVFKENPGK
ncbi:MAG: DUF4197 domain-containing protein [Desulfobacterales bacterium]|nr:DUF4197 domain-containing protein [Desulfobacterales bacterium]